jgi:hypothetical protein
VGSGAANLAVVDAGPLIHLSEIGCLPLLRVFDILVVLDSDRSKDYAAKDFSRDY